MLLKPEEFENGYFVFYCEGKHFKTMKLDVMIIICCFFCPSFPQAQNQNTRTGDCCFFKHLPGRIPSFDKTTLSAIVNE